MSNVDQKCQWHQTSEQLLEFFRCDPNDFLSRLVTMDKTWLYHYDPETKQQQWSGGIAAHPAPKNSECNNLLEKFLPRFFWDQEGILLNDYLPKGQTINAEYYSSPLVQWKDILKEKYGGKATKGVLFLHDNAPAQWALATQKKLAYLGFQCLDHQPYSLDLAPLNYHLFPGLKKQLKVCHFLSDAKVIAAVETWLDGQSSEFF